MHPAQSKAKAPESFCMNERCLWNVARSGPCPRHATKVLDFPSTRPKLVCVNCGEPNDENRHKTCMTIEPDANPHGLPVYGTHEDIKESK